MDMFYCGLPQMLSASADDIRKTALEEGVDTSGKWSLDAQIRAYDLLSVLLDSAEADLADAAKEVAAFCEAYDSYGVQVEAMYDASALQVELRSRMEPLERACSDARFEAAAAAGLHEFAKETFHIWQTSGIFMRKRALKALRERAGFQLESHRIGNYVAKTFDLMNESQMRFAQAQQKLFAADVAYKVRPGVCSDIYARLTNEK